MCPGGEENWTLVNTCDVSHMGKDQEFVFCCVKVPITCPNGNVSKQLEIQC